MTAPTRPAPRPASAVPAVPAFDRPTLPAGALLDLARRGLAEACDATSPAERYAAAHLAALRAAAAVLACRARPATSATRRRRPTSAWVLLAVVAPEMREWAAFFAAGARKRALAEAGLPTAVTPREADDLVRDVEAFLSVVQTTLGIDSQLLLASGGAQ